MLKGTKVSQYIIAIILYICAYLYSLKFAVYIQNRDEDWCKSFRKIHESCILGCPTNTEFITDGRGDNYYIGASDSINGSSLKKCMATFWSATHFMLYVLIGFFCPDLFYETLILGASFELFEYYKYDCADPLDILFNTSGFIVGKGINAYIYEEL